MKIWHKFCNWNRKHHIADSVVLGYTIPASDGMIALFWLVWIIFIISVIVTIYKII